MKKSLTLLFLLLSFTSVTIAQNDTSKDSIRTFYEGLFEALESQFIYRDSVDFDALKPVFMDRALSCSTFTQALYQATPLFDTIGGAHCMIFWQNEYVPASPKKQLDQEDFSYQFLLKYQDDPGFEVKVLDGHYGYILMPGLMTLSGDPDSLSKLTHIWYDQIVEVETNNDIKGWIIDLRFNGGGTSGPMTLALYNLLGNTDVYNELDHKKEIFHTQFMKDGMYHYADTLEFTIKTAGKVDTKIPVAIVNGLMTASAGENVAIAFRGRENVQYIGEETYGFLTGNELAKLPFGAQMPLTSGYFADRNAYFTPSVVPDIPISKGDNFEDLLQDENIKAAIKFIDSKALQTIEGDFNGDGKTEQLWIESNNENGAPMCTIKCSDASIPAITIDTCFGGHLVFEEDLNGNGSDEFSFIQFGDASEWMSCQLYTFTNGKWCKPIDAFSIYGFGVKEDRIRKATKKNRVIVQKDGWEYYDIRQKEVTLKFR